MALDVVHVEVLVELPEEQYMVGYDQDAVVNGNDYSFPVLAFC
jgi:hypothetical protein